MPLLHFATAPRHLHQQLVVMTGACDVTSADVGQNVMLWCVVVRCSQGIACKGDVVKHGFEFMCVMVFRVVVMLFAVHDVCWCA